MDWPYILLVFLLLIMAYMEGAHDDSRFYKISIIIVFLFIGFRAPVVGADTWGYYKFFTGMQDYYNSSDVRDVEPMLVVYNFVLGVLFFKNGLLYMLANTFFSLFFIHKLIDRYSQFKTFSVLCFFIVFDYLIYFIALRQLLGYSILLFGILYVLDEKPRKWLVYGVCTIFAYFFHTTMILYAAVFLLMFFVPIKKSIYVVLIFLSLYIGFILKSYDITSLFELYLNAELGATERLENYMDNPEWIGSETPITIIMRPSIIGLLIVLFLKDEYMNHWFTKIYLVAICVNNLLYDFTMLQRLNFCFSIFSIILLSWVFSRVELFDKYYSPLKLVFVLFVSFFLRSYIIKNSDASQREDDNMHPYITIFEDYSEYTSTR